MSNSNASEINHIGQRLRQLRISNNLTQRESADKIGISFSHISKLEHGIGTISDATLLKVAKAYDVSFNWLKTGEGENSAIASDLEERAPTREDICKIIRIIRNPKIIHIAQHTSKVMNIPLKKALRIIISSMLQ